MIAGETENIIGLDTEDSFYEYDELFGLGGKNKQKSRRMRTPEEIAARKEKRKNFWKGFGNTVKDNGGLEGVTNSISNVFGIFRKNSTQGGPSDFQFGVGATGAIPESSNKTSVGLYVVGGAVVIGLVVWGVTMAQKKKQVPLNPNPTK